ncbi:universal stress protein [Mycobacteroides franklinii]|uniref:Universal stress protein n=1 Tax=Mycobacteroides franklinii TaxID=948102 RepID=A0A4R8QXU5_9MYCO|nr:universal stress protein [Mycobacteroides franklinii]TDZ45201.1 Universal stress protein [Mycobacteroides franklinii]TDZ48692.1 Universal stress protein [Mycobacteroides franklinii]TDZ58873.1 Universal stress protein [Mycobacteroides franklinii]TDZ66387.1 Universal stress protein [Mycobacteroides franklinii]TDZ72310.1 Universal stress protein [Mycobacteroides franklinii]
MDEDLDSGCSGEGQLAQDQDKSAPAVVVGIDGSHRALAAALWAVDEAVSRDIPLRLVYAIEPRQQSRDDIYGAYDLATAEIATQGAVIAVQSRDKPVKIEVEIHQGSALDVLIRESHSAALVCLGALGRDRATARRATSTAAALSAHAHCPVVIVRGRRPCQEPRGTVLIEFGDSADFDDVMTQGLNAAAVSAATVRVVACWSRHGSDTSRPSTDVNTLRAHMEKLLEPWRHQYPDTVIDSVVWQGNIAEYLAQERDPIHLLAVGRHRKQGLVALIDHDQSSTAPDIACSIMISGHRRPL